MERALREVEDAEQRFQDQVRADGEGEYDRVVQQEREVERKDN